jgi:hypothetical protein
MHKPVKYIEKALTYAANGAWFITTAAPGAALDHPLNFGGLFAGSARRRGEDGSG